MKTKPAILTVLLACAALPLWGNEAPVAFNTVATVDIAESPAGSGQIEIKVRQIELDVALKQYEKIATALAEAQSSLELGELSDVEFKEKRSRTEEKLVRLAKIKDQLRAEIMRADADLQALRKKYGVTADAPVPRADDSLITVPVKKP